MLKRLNVRGYRHYHNFDAWMRKGLLDSVESELLAPDARVQAFISASTVHGLVRETRNGTADRSYLLQVLLNPRALAARERDRGGGVTHAVSLATAAAVLATAVLQPVAAIGACRRCGWRAPDGPVVRVTSVAELERAVSSARAGETILVAAGDVHAPPVARAVHAARDDPRRTAACPRR